MGIRSWFSIPVTVRTPRPVEKGAVVAAQEDATVTQQVGSFVSPELLLAFSGMTAAITVIWTFIEGMIGLPHNLWIGFVISVICGGALFVSDLTDPKRSARPSVVLRVIAAVVNTILLFNAASGSHDLAIRGLTQTPRAATSTSAPAPPAG